MLAIILMCIYGGHAYLFYVQQSLKALVLYLSNGDQYGLPDQRASVVYCPAWTTCLNYYK